MARPIKLARDGIRAPVRVAPRVVEAPIFVPEPEPLIEVQELSIAVPEEKEIELSDDEDLDIVGGLKDRRVSYRGRRGYGRRGYGKGRYGKNRKGKGRYGKNRKGKGRNGKDRKGKGRYGYRRDW